MPGKKSDSAKRSRKFCSLLVLNDKVPKRFSGIELIPARKTWRQVLKVVGSVVVARTKNSSEWVFEEAKKGNSRGILIQVLLDNVQPAV